MHAMKHEMISTLGALSAGASFKWLVWFGFAVVFYNSGETCTVWLLEPGQIEGGRQWAWIVMFPTLLPAFFVVNRWCGCGSGACTAGQGLKRFPGH
jgi:hypothetical protein